MYILRDSLCLISPTDKVRTISIHGERSYSHRLTDGVDVLRVRHLQTELVFLQFDKYILSRSSDCRCLDMAFTIRRSPHLRILVHKRLPTELSTYLFLLVIANSETKSIRRKPPHYAHYRRTVPQHRLEVCHQPGTIRVRCDLSDVLHISEVQKYLCYTRVTDQPTSL